MFEFNLSYFKNHHFNEPGIGQIQEHKEDNCS